VSPYLANNERDFWLEKNQKYLAERLDNVQVALERLLSSSSTDKQSQDESLEGKDKLPSASSVYPSSSPSSESPLSGKALASDLLNSIANQDRLAEHKHKGSSNYETKHVAVPSSNYSSTIKPSIEMLSDTFGLSNFESLVLLLCAGVELRSSIANLCSRAHGGNNLYYATFELAFAAFAANAHWSALSPSSPLRNFQLIRLIEHPEMPIVKCPMRIQERVLHYLLGISYLEKGLTEYAIKPLSDALDVPLASSHKDLAGRILLLINNGEKKKKKSNENDDDNDEDDDSDEATTPTTTRLISSGVISDQVDKEVPSEISCVHLWGKDMLAKEIIAKTICKQLGKHLWQVKAEMIPTKPAEIEIFAGLWSREASLLNAGILILADNLSSEGAGIDLSRTITSLLSLDILPKPIFLSTTNRWLSSLGEESHPCIMSFEVAKPSRLEQYQIWQECFRSDARFDLRNRQAELLNMIENFDFSSSDIVAAFNDILLYASLNSNHTSSSTISSALNTATTPLDADSALTLPSTLLESIVWSSCRKQATPDMGELATPVIPKATLEELVLPTKQLKLLKWIAYHVKNRGKVYREWGFGNVSNRGNGITALFEGESGTGKTMAAEAVANMLNMDLLKIDLSTVISKYIGETEKNLRRVFDKAERGGVILFFDEADTIFGKRTDVKDSHDRYANIEIGYLLQRMEQYGGLAILATNMKTALDRAFVRRIRFIVDFPFPEEKDRAEIWRRIFPKETPTKDLDVAALAKLNITGGVIRNIALNASFLAAEQGAEVGMSHIMEAARFEYEKMGRTLTSGDLGSR
jgi:AAA+ superfamily predicted ATPase